MFFVLHWKLMELDAILLKWVAIDYGLVIGITGEPVMVTLAVYKIRGGRNSVGSFW